MTEMKRIHLVLLLALAAAASSCAPGTSGAENRAEAIAAEILSPGSDYVIVVSHRGDWRNFPENSIPAIESVIRMGADIVEIDIRMTKDSVLVLSHDATLDRCTDGTGLVSDHTFKEISELRLKRAHGQVTSSVRMPSLREALLCTRDRICVNIDKGYDYYGQVLALAEELDMVSQILIKGKKPLEQVKEDMAGYSRNLMYMPIIDLGRESGQELLGVWMDSDTVPPAYEICWEEDDGTMEETAARIARQGSRVWVNTLWESLCGGPGNDDDSAYVSGDPAKVYGRYLDAGVTMIQTDRPELLIDYLGSIGRHSLGGFRNTVK